MRSLIMGGVAVVSALAAADARAAVINVGNQTVPQNATSAQVNINVTGGEAVTGFNLAAVLGNGSAPGAEPVFSAVQFTGGTIFDGSPTTVTGGPIAGLPQDAQASVVFNSAGVSTTANGLLVKLFINTTGFAPGSTFALSLGNNEIGNSTFIPTGGTGGTVTPTIINGTITIVPEPAAVGLFGTVGLGLLARRRRRVG